MVGERIPEQATRSPARVSGRSVAGLAGLVLGLAYTATVLLPYYASDLDELSLARLAGGAHDPTGRGWGSGIPPWLHLPGFVVLLLAPLGALLALGGSVVQLLV